MSEKKMRVSLYKLHYHKEKEIYKFELTLLKDLMNLKIINLIKIIIG